MIELWAGSVGTRLDDFGNIYDIYKNTLRDKLPEPDLIAMYQSILADNGIITTHYDVINQFDGTKTTFINFSGKHYSKSFGYRTDYSQWR